LLRPPPSITTCPPRVCVGSGLTFKSALREGADAHHGGGGCVVCIYRSTTIRSFLRQHVANMLGFVQNDTSLTRHLRSQKGPMSPTRHRPCRRIRSGIMPHTTIVCTFSHYLSALRNLFTCYIQIVICFRNTISFFISGCCYRS
jgi:hypothetical protein